MDTLELFSGASRLTAAFSPKLNIDLETTSCVAGLGFVIKGNVPSSRVALKS